MRSEPWTSKLLTDALINTRLLTFLDWLKLVQQDKCFLLEVSLVGRENNLRKDRSPECLKKILDGQPCGLHEHYESSDFGKIFLKH